MHVTMIGSGAMAPGVATRFLAVGAPVQIPDRKPENAAR
jgi:3-hydroxyisobutyrate dehydrogenase-like beta-hydroxyacid dehydrogenase